MDFALAPAATAYPMRFYDLDQGSESTITSDFRSAKFCETMKINFGIFEYVGGSFLPDSFRRMTCQRKV